MNDRAKKQNVFMKQPTHLRYKDNPVEMATLESMGLGSDIGNIQS